MLTPRARAVVSVYGLALLSPLSACDVPMRSAGISPVPDNPPFSVHPMTSEEAVAYLTSMEPSIVRTSTMLPSSTVASFAASPSTASASPSQATLMVDDFDYQYDSPPGNFNPPESGEPSLTASAAVSLTMTSTGYENAAGAGDVVTTTITSWVSGSGRLAVSVNNGTPAAIPDKCSGFIECVWGVGATGYDCLNNSLRASAINRGKVWWADSYFPYTHDMETQAVLAEVNCNEQVTSTPGTPGSGGQTICYIYRLMMSTDGGNTWHQVGTTWTDC